MPIKDPIKRQEYINKWKRESRLKRGLKKQGRKPYTEEEKVIAKKNRKIYQKEWAKEHPWATRPLANRLLWNAKSRSNKYNIEFNITIEDINIPTHCPYLGIELISSQSKGDTKRHVASLDRIDPTKGYIKGNVEVISHLANTMKNNASLELLILFANNILKRNINEENMH